MYEHYCKLLEPLISLNPAEDTALALRSPDTATVQ